MEIFGICSCCRKNISGGQMLESLSKIAYDKMSHILCYIHVTHKISLKHNLRQIQPPTMFVENYVFLFFFFSFFFWEREMVGSSTDILIWNFAQTLKISLRSKVLDRFIRWKILGDAMRFFFFFFEGVETFFSAYFFLSLMDSHIRRFKKDILMRRYE